MASVTTSASAPRRMRLAVPELRAPWPEGTIFFAFRTWVALAICYYAAFFFQLEGASSAGVCVLILAQPAQGMVLSKAVYRLIGTIVGVTVAMVMTSLFPQDRTMLLAAFTVFMALQTAAGSLLRDFRSYACILAGYTVAIISIADLDAPLSVFGSAVNRVAAIVLGIIAIAVTNFFLASAESSRSLMEKLRDALSDVRTMAERAIDERRAPDPQSCVAMAGKLMPLRGEISYATPEKPDGIRRARGARSALLGLFELITGIQAIGSALDAAKGSPEFVACVSTLLRKALRHQAPASLLGALEAATLPRLDAGTLSMEEAYLFDRAHYFIDTLAEVRDGLRALRFGRRVRRIVSLPVHQDYVAVFLNAFRVLIAVGIAAVLGVMSGMADTRQAVLFTAVFVSLGAVQPNPSVMGKTALFGMPLVVVTGIVYVFFVFPLIDGYPLFILSLAPLVFVMCWLIKSGLGGAGLIYGVQCIVIISPANVQAVDPDTFTATATMLTISGVAIFLSTMLVMPVDPAQRRLRLAIAVGDNLRRALADESRLPQPRASQHYDRLAQFKVWQRDEAPTPARLNTMKRLTDIGNLAYAVRRSWRSLDATRTCVEPKLDAEARRILPTLSPDKTFEIARAYLAEAANRDPKAAMAVIRAAAALYGTAMLTRMERHLLRRVRLLETAP